ncbi:MAG TPA: OmpA family protein [Flavobacteriaceae bacterium]|nr:OmpA family protein [Flavobacteriaceae bacterium]MCB9213448.1 OmpA family protein [Alteromonas sp.]HPF12249.1 OmpA family protein [Flavobacteriaceae bacterium]HQU22466.1 OmpA family protein [Flavobacteriaceae bacterium]HQU66509.1 OmpA family protein [Flavobacteriaceae bacterium]
MKKVIIVLMALFAFQVTAEAQILDKVKRKVKQKKDQEENKAIDKGIDEIFKKKDEDTKDGNDGDGEEGSQGSGPSVTPGMSPKKERDIWMQRYDFQPGSEILFFDDFEGEQLGEIPSKWQYNKGNIEVVQIDGTHNKVLNGDLGHTRPNWEEGFVLPEAYTIEFDVFMADPNAKDKGFGSYGYHVYFYPNANYQHSNANMDIAHAQISLQSIVTGKVPDLTANDLANSWNHISISVNGNSIKAYFNDYRVFNTRLNTDGRPMLFSLWNCCQTGDKPVFLMDNFKVAAGAHPRYDELIVNGRLTTNNILFESGSAQLLPRSYAEINRIAKVLKANPNTSFSIEGHTDNVGGDSDNLELSKARAKAVADALSDLGVERSRLTTTGFGEAIPIADNGTPEGRAMNRRVEFVVQL